MSDFWKFVDKHLNFLLVLLLLFSISLVVLAALSIPHGALTGGIKPLK